MQFHEKRRQQLLSESNCRVTLDALLESIQLFETKPSGVGKNEEELWLMSYSIVAYDRFNLLTLEYTAGEPIEPLRAKLEAVVVAYERYAGKQREHEKDPDFPAFPFDSVDEYCRLMQLVGLCYLLHRRDLLPRIAAMQDGLDGDNGGTDALFEELLIPAMGEDTRYQTDYLCALHPYERLFNALVVESKEAALKELQIFLKRWYKDLSGAGWHDAHKPDAQGRTGGYYGYWSFEAGAAVLLLGIEDDSSLHSYLYYPKDLVAWARANANVQADADAAATRLRCESGEPCPKVGYWMTPAKAGSRRYFQQGEIMPSIASDYGSTIWQWDSDQSDPKL